ncbi:MAG: fumarylacetoacetate hydrolase family protein [Geminicoccaceae bacterium]
MLGYTCANDVSERVIQKAEMAQGALVLCKGFDSFCPLGPTIATGLDPRDLKIGARVNGEVRQASSTSDLLFSVADLVAYFSTAPGPPAGRRDPDRHALGRRPGEAGRCGESKWKASACSRTPWWRRPGLASPAVSGPRAAAGCRRRSRCSRGARSC